MRTSERNAMNENTSENMIGLESPVWNELTSGPVSHVAYHEMSDVPVVRMDALAQLENNVLMLEELQSRMGFMMREVRGLLKV